MKEDRDRKFTHRKDAKQESRHRGRLHSSLLLVALPSPLLTVFFQLSSRGSLLIQYMQRLCCCQVESFLFKKSPARSRASKEYHHRMCKMCSCQEVLYFHKIKSKPETFFFFCNHSNKMKTKARRIFVLQNLLLTRNPQTDRE